MSVRLRRHTTAMETSLTINLLGYATKSCGPETVSAPEVDVVLRYLSWIGCNRPNVPGNAMLTVWHYALSIFYYVYMLFFVVFGVLDIISYFHQYLWIIYVTMCFKCFALRTAIVNIRRRAKCESFRSTLIETMDAMKISQQYLKIVLAVDVSAILMFYVTLGLFNGVHLIDTPTQMCFVLGTVAYVCYMSGVVLFSIADARLAQKRVLELIAGANDGTVDGTVYDLTHKEIVSLVENSYWVDGIIFIGAVINTVSAITILLLYRAVYSDMQKVVSLTFLLYVLTILWAPDVLFFVFLGPEIAEVNELVVQLQGTLADAKRDNWKEEVQRYDTLLKVLAKPIRYTAAGFYLDHGGVRSKLIGTIVAILLSVLRLVVVIVIEQ